MTTGNQLIRNRVNLKKLNNNNDNIQTHPNTLEVPESGVQRPYFGQITGITGGISTAEFGAPRVGTVHSTRVLCKVPILKFLVRE